MRLYFINTLGSNRFDPFKTSLGGYVEINPVSHQFYICLKSISCLREMSKYNVALLVGVEILQLIYMEEAWSYLASSCLIPLVNIFGSIAALF